ncbi:hypothetical protein EDB87DRAFT_1601640 [Lactarius vividus]|nr:hypothetical protein EDB87DRAFT_1601640 [Lactarius vividus]
MRSFRATTLGTVCTPFVWPSAGSPLCLSIPPVYALCPPFLHKSGAQEGIGDTRKGQHLDKAEITRTHNQQDHVKSH